MSYDLIVIGAGPAGMAAATTASTGGAKVLLLDDQSTPGGQIYRAIETAKDAEAAILGDEYMAGQPIVRAFRAQGIDYVPDAVVWQVSEEREVGYSSGGRAKLISAPWVILATGAIERPFPIPGWTLPGVMMAGAAQTLLKSSGVAAEGAIFAGCGPLLYLVARQYLRAGVNIAAVVDTTPKANRMGALPHLPHALLRWDLLAKGRRWISEIRRSGTPLIQNATALKVIGDKAAQSLVYKTADVDWREIKATHIFLHQGIVPNVNLSMAAGLDHSWDNRQLCWRPLTDAWGCSSVSGIAVAGDGAGIGGGLAAEAGGQIAAIGVLSAVGKLDAQASRDQARRPRAQLAHEHHARPFLDAWFRPASDMRVPNEDTTIICRCEELTLKNIRDTIDIGLAGPNQLKSFCRAGMGPCQGRCCGLTVQELIARETKRPAALVGYYRLRPPIKPLRLEELANLAIDDLEGDDAGQDR